MASPIQIHSVTLRTGECSHIGDHPDAAALILITPADGRLRNLSRVAAPTPRTTLHTSADSYDA